MSYADMVAALVDEGGYTKAEAEALLADMGVNE
jgi:hypothetical protein